MLSDDILSLWVFGSQWSAGLMHSKPDLHGLHMVVGLLGQCPGLSVRLAYGKFVGHFLA